MPNCHCGRPNSASISAMGSIAPSRSPIEIPPARNSVRYKIEIPVGRPFRLEHRLVWPARDPARVTDCPIREDVPDPSLRRHPRHIGMSPGQPAHAVSVGAETWRRIEVVPRDENLGDSCAGEVDADERGDRFSCPGVILPDANHARPARIYDAIGVSQRILRGAGWSRRHRARRPACILAIEPLIDIVREIYYAVADGERAAAILVSARANAESVSVVGRDAFRLPIRADAVDESSSLLLRLSLAPIDCVAVQCDLFEADGVADDEVGGYGRRPKAIGAGGHASRPVPAFCPERHKAPRAASQLFDRLADHEPAPDQAARYPRRMASVVGDPAVHRGIARRNSLDQDLSLRQRESASIANGETFGLRNPAGRKASTI